MQTLKAALASVPFCLRKRLFFGKTLIIAALAVALVAVTKMLDYKAAIVIFVILVYNIYDVVNTIRCCSEEELVIIQATCLSSIPIKRHEGLKRTPIVGLFFNSKVDGYDCIFSVETSTNETFQPNEAFKLPICLGMMILEGRKYRLYFRKNAPVLSNSFFLGIELV